MAGGQFKSNRRTRARGVDPKLRRRVLSLAGGMCEILSPGCTGVATEVDHIIPVAEGGADELDNLQAACPGCHRIKTQAEAARGRAKFSRLRPASAHPADRWRVPAAGRGVGSPSPPPGPARGA